MHFEFVLRLKCLTQGAVCRDPPRNQNFFSIEVPRCLDCFREKRIDNRRLERCCQISNRQRRIRLLQLIDLIEYGGLESAEREIVGTVEVRAWEFESIRVARFGGALNRWTARVWKSQQTSDFVECLAS